MQTVASGDNHADCITFQTMFPGQNKINSNLLSAEYAQRACRVSSQGLPYVKLRGSSINNKILGFVVVSFPEKIRHFM